MEQTHRTRQVQRTENSPSGIDIADAKSVENLTGGGTTESTENFEVLQNLASESKHLRRALKLDSTKAIDNFRVQRLMGILPKKGKATLENIPSKGKASQFACTRYQFFLDAPFEISQQCCRIMKKNPAHSYAHKTGRHPMTAEMASESRLRAQAWIKNGCNGFDMVEPKSMPMIFWTEQDVLMYIKIHNLPIASVYGDIVSDDEDQMSLADLSEDWELFDACRPTFHTTGCNRTGCVFCGYGTHLKHDKYRFAELKETHPKLHEYIMKPWDEGGLGYKEVIDWINENGGFDIKY